MVSTRLVPASIFGRVLTGLATVAMIATGAPAARAANDCTEAAPANQCLPGGGPSNVDCMMEWKIGPQPGASSSGIPKNRVSCTEGDSSCDVDPNLDDGVCKFRASWCINNTDARIPACFQSDVSTMEVDQPFYLSDALVDRANIAAIQGAIGPGGLGPYVVQNGHLVYAGGVVNHLNLCSPPIDLTVQMPLDARSGKYKKTRQKFTIRAAAGDGRIDTDNFMLYCVPSRCGDGKKQKGEECDDGNRVDGDGCSSFCRRENIVAPECVNYRELGEANRNVQFNDNGQT
ncbi:MAG: myxococcus cysteine-rich repeat containing protein, partial [Alphaproteobacteria bacterium]